MTRLKELLGWTITRSRAEVIAILERELRGEVSDGEWDEFQCVHIADPSLDAIREAVPLAGHHTGAGRAAIERSLAVLRSS